jgi:hypothetical protein
MPPNRAGGPTNGRTDPRGVSAGSAPGSRQAPAKKRIFASREITAASRPPALPRISRHVNLDRDVSPRGRKASAPPPQGRYHARAGRVGGALGWDRDAGLEVHEHSIQEHGMQVGIQLQVGACPLHDGHGSAATSLGSLELHVAAVPTQDRIDEDAGDRPRRGPSYARRARRAWSTVNTN